MQPTCHVHLETHRPTAQTYTFTRTQPTSKITKKIQYAYQVKLDFYDSTDKRTSINMQALCCHLLTL